MLLIDFYNSKRKSLIKRYVGEWHNIILLIYFTKNQCVYTCSMVDQFALELNKQGAFVVPEEVAGKVVVVTNEDIQCTAITVTFKGRATCFAQHRHYLNYHWYIKLFGVFLGDETIVEEKKVLWEPGPDRTLHAGPLDLPFAFPLSQSSFPSSYNGCKGRIRYEIKATIVRDPLESSKNAYALVQIVDRVKTDANIPALMSPFEQNIKKTVYSPFGGNRTITLTVSLPRQRFCIGERIPLRIHLDNGSKRKVTLRAAVVKTTTYLRDGPAKILSASHCLYQILSPPVGGGATFQWAESQLLTITSAIPTIENSNVIKLQYSFLIEVLIPWCSGVPSILVPFTLGNVPPESLTGQPLPSPQYPPLKNVTKLFGYEVWPSDDNPKCIPYHRYRDEPLPLRAPTTDLLNCV